MDKEAMGIKAEEVSNETRFTDIYPEREGIIEAALTQVWNEAVEAAAEIATQGYDYSVLEVEKAIRRLRIEGEEKVGGEGK